MFFDELKAKKAPFGKKPAKLGKPVEDGDDGDSSGEMPAVKNPKGFASPLSGQSPIAPGPVSGQPAQAVNPSSPAKPPKPKKPTPPSMPNNIQPDVEKAKSKTKKK